MKIALSGASGFIGSALSARLKSLGYEVFSLVRASEKSDHEIFYDYENKQINRGKLAKCDAVIHLAGKNIGKGLWTKSFKKEVYDSRVISTRFLSHALAELKTGPRIFLVASAIGIYGDRKDLKLDEESSVGKDFLAKLCVDWERGTLFAKSIGIRVVNMRFGHVFDKEGGFLKTLAPFFKAGLGATMSTGEQYLSYVTRNELIEQIIFILKDSSINGPTNMVAYEPVTNKSFTKAFAEVFHKKAYLTLPAFLLKALGDQGKVLLFSQRVYPKKLLNAGFLFEESHDVGEVLYRIYDK